MSNNRVNCWEALRAERTTTEPVTADVMVGKAFGLGNQQPSFMQVRLHEEGSTIRAKAHRAKRPEAPGSAANAADDDMICPLVKARAALSGAVQEVAFLSEHRDENQLGVSAGLIWGLKKTTFNGADFATVVLSSYAAQH